MTGGTVTGGTVPDAEHELAARVIDALLREDYAGLARRVRTRHGEPVLDLPATGQPGLTLPLEPDASVVSLSLTLGASRRSALGGSNAIIEPTRCPPGGFPFAAALTYAEGPTQDIATATPCPR